jgi:endonuclease/exonuclease/phosphatase family metal-dependent hydrolase
MRNIETDIRLWKFLLISMVAFHGVQSAAAVIDVPISGRLLKMRASQSDSGRRSLTYRSDPDMAIGPPFATPTSTASLLVFASSASGECRVEVDLPAANWTAVRNDGANRGWRYRDPTGAAAGIRRVEIRRSPNGGRIVVKARGANFPCGLEAADQTLPVEVVLRLGDTRYCASFGSSVARNDTGHFKSENAPAPAVCPDNDFTVANLNVLHGLFCPPPTTQCRLTDRIDLLGQWIVERGCPDAVALQEVFDLGGPVSIPALVQDKLLDICPFPYEVAYLKTNTIDDSLVLSRYPVLLSQILIMHNNFRNVLHVRMDHPIGAVDLFSTHLASGADLGSSPCAVQLPCPQECVNAGAVTVRDCQAVQLAAIVNAQHDGDAPAVVVGDFNAQPSSFVYNQMTNAGWVDTHLAAGNPECVPATGVGCTSGREDSNLTDLESSTLNVATRIDYVFLVPPGPASICSGALDTPADADGDGVGTRLFADEPNPFSVSCGPSPDPICWISDHTGVQADVNCD